MIRKYDFGTSYLRFWARCESGEFKGWTENGLAQEFTANVSKKDCRVADVGEVVAWLHKTFC